MENGTIHCPPDLSPDERETFLRVWRRVMPEDRADSPIEVLPADMGGDLPCACLCPTPGGDLLPVPVDDTPSPHRCGDFPDATDVPRLGPGSAVYSGRLQQQVTDALECWQLYRCLARRSGGGRCGRQLAGMASEKHHAARRLAAACFLITGVRFWPVEQLRVPQIPSYLGAIRAAYQTEQQRQQAYLLSAADTGDEALEELFQDLATQSGEHGQLLRAILEQMELR